MRQLSVAVEPAANVLTTVYTVPLGYHAKINVMYIHNFGGTKHISVYWVGSAGTIDLLNQVPMNSKTYLVIEAPIVLEETDQLQVLTENGSTFTFVATLEQIGSTRV